jgi:predicted nucleotidyltransferase
MDKTKALAICKKYLLRLKENYVDFSEAWLFGSYANGNQRDESDIDIAIILNDVSPIPFDTEVKLMTFREGEELLIEPHVFSKNEFVQSLPLVDQIIKYGIPIQIQ